MSPTPIEAQNPYPEYLKKGIYCDSDSDCFLIPGGPLASKIPVLVYLSCTGGKPWDVDSLREISEKMGWGLATCGKSRNHRDPRHNEMDILKIVYKIRRITVIDTTKIFLFGFSGQGAQALGFALRHPELIRGTITDCAHHGLITQFDPFASRHQLFYLITRELDWNRYHNELLYNAFVINHIKDTLIIAPGEHDIGPRSEIFEGCLWFIEKMSE